MAISSDMFTTHFADFADAFRIPGDVRSFSLSTSTEGYIEVECRFSILPDDPRLAQFFNPIEKPKAKTKNQRHGATSKKRLLRKIDYTTDKR